MLGAGSLEAGHAQARLVVRRIVGALEGVEAEQTVDAARILGIVAARQPLPIVAVDGLAMTGDRPGATSAPKIKHGTAE